MPSNIEMVKDALDNSKTSLSDIQSFIISKYQKTLKKSSISTAKSIIKKIEKDKIPLQNPNTAITIYHNPNRDNLPSAQILRNGNPQLQAQAQAQDSAQAFEGSSKQAAAILALNSNPSLINGGAFSLGETVAPDQPEGSIMAEAYQSTFGEESANLPKDPTKKVYPIKRLSTVAKYGGNIMQAYYKTPFMQKMTNGYEIPDESLKDLNQDLEEVIKNRVGLIDSEYGDIINIGIDIFSIGFVDPLLHKIKNPKARKELSDQVQESKENFQKQVEQAREITEQDQSMSSADPLMCSICNQYPIVENSMCNDCGFAQKMKQAQSRYDNE